MDLLTMLLEVHNKSQTNKIVEFIGNDSDRFDELMRLFFEGEPLVVQRASWPIGILGVKYPSLFYPYIQKSLNYMDHGKVHDAVIRNILRILMHLEVPEDYQSYLIDLCLKYIETPNIPSAIKAFSIGVLQQICLQHPELANEIRLVLEELFPFEKPAFKARAKEFFNDFKKRPR